MITDSLKVTSFIIPSTTHIQILANSKINRFSISKHKKKLHPHANNQNDLDISRDVPNILNSEELEKNVDEKTFLSQEDNSLNEKLTYEDFRLSKENSSDENGSNNLLDSKDKRRHYLIKAKQFLHLGKK